MICNCNLNTNQESHPPRKILQPNRPVQCDGRPSMGTIPNSLLVHPAPFTGNQTCHPGAPFCAPGSPFYAPGLPFYAPGSPFYAPGSPFKKVGASFCALGSTFCAPHQNLKFKTKATYTSHQYFFNKMLKAYESDNDVVMNKGIYLIAFTIKYYIRN